MIHRHAVMKQESKESAGYDYCSLVKIAAIPIPDPIHMLVTKIFAPVSFAIGYAVAIWRDPAN